jgi:hypothetical protein
MLSSSEHPIVDALDRLDRACVCTNPATREALADLRSLLAVVVQTTRTGDKVVIGGGVAAEYLTQGNSGNVVQGANVGQIAQAGSLNGNVNFQAT